MIEETKNTKSKCLLEQSGSHVRMFEIKLLVAIDARGSSAIKNLSALQYISQVDLKKVVQSEERATWISCTSEPVKLVKKDKGE